mgnify:FL=1
MLFRDAAYVMIRKILPKEHLKAKYPDYKNKIKNANSLNDSDVNYSEKATSRYRKDFGYKDVDGSESVTPEGERDELVEFYEVYEKIKVSYVNVFYRRELPPEQLEQIQQQVQVRMQEMQSEMEVQ